MFSILIPTWNNLDYLKLCIDSIKRNSANAHEIIIHVNEGTDGTLDWVRSQGLKHSSSPQNIGVCLAVNCLAAQATQDWIVYLNDDMYCCPGWDTALEDAIRKSPTQLAMFFSTAIEPGEAVPPMVSGDFGRGPADFDEARLLKNYMTYPQGDLEGALSQPTVVSRMWWHLVGGYSIEFSPGITSDDDLALKFWALGCRDFRVVGGSRVYHFAMRSTGRIRKNRGGRTLTMKWGMTRPSLRSNLPRGANSPAPRATFTGSLKRFGYAFQDYPLRDLEAWNGGRGFKIKWD